MNPYLLETKYASERLIGLLNAEQERLENAQAVANEMQLHAKNLFESMKVSGFTPEGVIELDGFERSSKAYSADAAEIAQLLSILPNSLGAIAGALLQIAKQGISSVYGGLSQCPCGRIVAGEPLKSIIWQARNQAMHYEEGAYHPAVRACFAQLATNAGQAFTLGRHNLAHQVVVLLNWRSYIEYERDMAALLP